MKIDVDCDAESRTVLLIVPMEGGPLHLELNMAEAEELRNDLIITLMQDL